jgi:hypothetical protein
MLAVNICYEMKRREMEEINTREVIYEQPIKNAIIPTKNPCPTKAVQV